MQSVFIVVRLNDDDSIAEVISAHPNKSTADSAERYYRSQNYSKFLGLRTEIQEVEFEV